MRALHDYHVLFTWGRDNCILFSRNYGSGTELNDFEDIMVGNSAKKKMLLNQEKHKNNRSRKPTSGGYRLKGHRQAAGTVFLAN